MRSSCKNCVLLPLFLLPYFLLVFLLHDQLQTYETRPAHAAPEQVVGPSSSTREAGDENSGVTAPVLPGCPQPQQVNVFRQLHSAVYVYSAYVDERGGRWIRMVTLLSVHEWPVFLCNWENGSYTTPVTFYQMCENHGKQWGGWLLSCVIPSQLKKLPCEVELVRKIQENINTIRIPLFMTQRREKSDFAVCVPPLFGRLPSSSLVAFIEMTRILGAQHFVFYVQEAVQEIQTVLSYYGKRGIITSLPWQLPITPRNIWYHGQLPAINDCLYRTMHKYNHVFFCDMDEFIVPRQRANWTGMLNQLNASADTCAFTFQSAFFDPLLSPAQLLADLESDLRTKSFSQVRSKVLVKPNYIFELGIHHISRTINASLQVMAVAPDVGLVHHYRSCLMDYDPKMNCRIFARDGTLLRFIPTLRHNVQTVLYQLKELQQQEDIR